MEQNWVQQEGYGYHIERYGTKKANKQLFAYVGFILSRNIKFLSLDTKWLWCHFACHTTHPTQEHYIDIFADNKNQYIWLL